MLRTNESRPLIILVGMALLGASAAVFANALTPDEVRSIAKDACIFGLPLVENYRRMYAEAVAEGGTQFRAAFNRLRHEAKLFAPADREVVTPNIDVANSHLWMDLRAEPVVLGVPQMDSGRYYAIQLIDLQTFNFAFIGSRSTGNDGGTFLIAGPNWEEESPEGVTKVIRCETGFALAVYRTRLFGADDLDNVNEIQSRYTVQTLSEFLGQAAPQAPANVEFPPISDEPLEGLEFFEYLDFLLGFCAPHPSEAELRGRLAMIGIGTGQAFESSKASAEIQAALNAGFEEGQAAIKQAAATVKSARFGSRADLKNDYRQRAVAATVGLHGNSREEMLSALYLTDGEGQPLDGSNTDYYLQFDSGKLPPVDGFWSVTIYDGQTQGLVANPIDRYQISSSMLPELTHDADGKLTLFVQRESPGMDKDANWLPAPEGPFYAVLRLYAPKPEVLDGSWTAPLVWPEDTTATEPVHKPEGAGDTQQVEPSAIAKEARPEMERPTVWGEPTEVRVGTYVIDLDEVDSAQQNFAASVFYEARWKNPALQHKGPGPLHRGLTEVWTPRLAIAGLQMAWTAYPEFVEIQPDGEVVYRQKVWGRFSQPMNLRDFPLDTQTLSIHFAAAGLMEDEVKIVPLEREHGRQSGIAESFSVPDFDVVSWNAEPTPYLVAGRQIGTAGFLMQITVKRRVNYYVMKVIIPLCLIVIMSWLPRWIDPEHIGTNIGISTTAFLTLIAYLFAVTVMLPRVSYVTRMDEFIMLSTLLVFVCLLQTVASTSLVKTCKRLVKWIDYVSRAAYPLLLAGVVVYSFAL